MTIPATYARAHQVWSQQFSPSTNRSDAQLRLVSA
ncbi:hypothetical protein ATK36_5267 [Amycolatopsis sulphurea]|uniref:Uncharacterized protein n=1 Tax=Amycolatopsis sulphurea TaxID=76022 RepID=A0A2A9FHZ0_9PSEU|nr:hypothetical protein ATK36_5267 [Amycolatopsis sulphurea]